MAKTLFNGVNEIFKRTKVIAGDAAALTTLTDSARQHPIDLAVQVINEGVDDLYSHAEMTLPKQQGESTITLVAGTREYQLASGLVRLKFPLIDRANSQRIYEYAGGYDAILNNDPEQDDTGLPYGAAISPITGYLRMDRAPTSIEAGRIYYYQYEKDVSLSAASDTFSFSDAVFRAMVPPWVQLYKRDSRAEFDQGIYQMSIGRASRFLLQKKARTSYLPR